MRSYAFFPCIPEEVFFCAVEGVADEAEGRAGKAVAFSAIGAEGHPGGMQLFAGFARGGKPVFEQRLIDRAALAVLFQHLQPHQIVLMAIIVVHGELPRDLCPQENGGTVDLIVQADVRIGEFRGNGVQNAHPCRT